MDRVCEHAKYAQQIWDITNNGKKKQQFTQMWIFYQGNRKPTFKGRQNQPVRFNVHQKETTAECSVGVELFDKTTKHSYILKNLIKFLRIPFA